MLTTSRVHRPRSVSADRATRPAPGLAPACAAAAAILTGCSTEQATCGGGEYPVMTIGSTGSACVPDGEEPPEGCTRYPQGKVPEHVGDTWDTYWRTHTVDRTGKVVEVPDSE
ncbi:SCO0607 family lipoprotein [Streptomyces sp. NPDC017890]|uniref:SCO0607 family lipoprotein n=1 Tax=Streptomyces sp. NPDC017890 TaxID=3365015 RepID=UPI0037A0A91E